MTITTSDEIKDLAVALNLAQSELRGAPKTETNPHFKNRYASLEAVIDTAKPVLNKHGLAFTQAPGALVEGAVEITTMLMHNSGQWIRSTLHMPVVKRDPQGVGSAITYGLRYSLMAVLGVPPTDDDDGERAMDRSQPQPRQEQNKAVSPVDDLIDGINRATTPRALDLITNSESNIRLYERSSEEDQKRINAAVADKRATLQRGRQ